MSFNQTEIQTQVNQILASFIQKATGWEGELDPEMSLINGGLIDSLSLVNVVVALQQNFSIEIGIPEITLENFDTLNAIYQMIENKLA
ncbi:acyl carrier protein [Candidatus Venteria ishoeyi]|uniref:acyl carrier protein n=1 Tax=Candidatus Venteria ishoeyi TaxID=1899563 RepID=UPI0025A4FA76|nr:acyl carrier protein [Candidatus Venteria ishoeyi]MDM8546907.1 acyl carrier protein [Candidatus Venteria ishoeyi]